MLFSPSFLRRGPKVPPLPLEVDVFAPHDVVLDGWLWKRGALNTNFKRRWFLLTIGGELFYYKSDKHTRYQNVIPLLDAVIQWNERSPQFEITIPERIYVMSASCMPEASAWVNALRRFTLCNNHENLSIEQAEAFLLHNEHAQCQAAEDERELRRQQNEILLRVAVRERLQRKAASSGCLQRSSSTRNVRAAVLAAATGSSSPNLLASLQGWKRPRAASTSLASFQHQQKAAETTKQPQKQRKEEEKKETEEREKPPRLARQPLPAKSAPNLMGGGLLHQQLMMPLALAAAGHHREEKVRRMRSTSN